MTPARMSSTRPEDKSPNPELERKLWFGLTGGQRACPQQCAIQSIFQQ